MRLLTILLCSRLAYALIGAEAPPPASKPPIPEQGTSKTPAQGLDRSPIRPADATLVSSKYTNDLTLLSNKYTNGVVLDPGTDDASIARTTARILWQAHYRPIPIDDDLSSKFLNRYLDMLDPAHLLFFQSDVREFEPYRTTLDELITKTGDITPAIVIFKRFVQHFEEQAAYVNELLQTAPFEFAGDERYLLDRRKEPRPKDLEEAKKLWRERVRYEYLQEKLNKEKEKPEEIVKTITRRYARMWRMLRQEWDSEDVLARYLTALANLYDPHSEYMNKPQSDTFTIGMSHTLFGIGALLSAEDGYCKIVELKPGPALESKKLKAGDKIIAVAQGTNEPVDVVDNVKLSKIVNMIRGPKGTEVRLTVIPADAPNSSVRKTVALIRDQIKLEDQDAKAKLIELPAKDDKRTRLGVIDLSSFYADMKNRGPGHKSTATDVARLLKKLSEEHVDGVILDLRHNGGGSLEEAINLTGLFIKEGPVVQVQGREGPPEVDKDTDPTIQYDGPLVVLTSRFSASASEILAGALQDYDRAVIVGDSSTHGKGTVQSLIDLDKIVSPNAGSLKITIRKFYRASGASTQLKGVTPDIVLPSLNNHAEVGEASLENPLPWDEITSAEYEKANQVQPYLAELKKRSDERVNSDKDFGYLREEIERYKKLIGDKTVSMNEAQRIKEKQETEARSQARKKELRARPESKEKIYEITLKLADNPGLPPPLAKTNAVASAQAKVKTEPADEDSDERVDDSAPAVDITLEEAKRILVDLISLSSKGQPLAVKN